MIRTDLHEIVTGSWDTLNLTVESYSLCRLLLGSPLINYFDFCVTHTGTVTRISTLKHIRKPMA